MKRELINDILIVIVAWVCSSVVFGMGIITRIDNASENYHMDLSMREHWLDMISTLSLFGAVFLTWTLIQKINKPRSGKWL